MQTISHDSAQNLVIEFSGKSRKNRKPDGARGGLCIYCIKLTNHEDNNPQNIMKSSSKILVIGSSNTDMTVKSPTTPRPGETVIGGEFKMGAG